MHHIIKRKGRKNLPVLTRQESGLTDCRLSVSLREETKKALENYAYATRQTLSRAADELIYKSATDYLRNLPRLTRAEEAAREVTA